MKPASRPTEASVIRLHSRLFHAGISILLLLSFLAVFLFLFFQFRTATFQSITAANDSFGNYVDSVLELTNANIRTSAMQMFYTSSIRNLRTSGSLTWKERTIGQRDLGSFVSSSAFVDSVMVYNQRLNMVFTSEDNYASAPAEQFHDQEAVALLSHPEGHSYLVPFRRQEGQSVHYAFLFYAEEPSGPSAMLIDVNARWYEAQLLGSLSRERHMIVDGEGQVVLPSVEAADLPPWELFEAAMADGGGSGYVLPEDSLFVSSCWVYHLLDQTGWYYLEHFRLEEAAPGLFQVQRVVLVVFAAVSAAVLGLLLYLFLYILPPFFHISRALDTANLGGQNSAEKFNALLSSHRAYEATRKLQELQAGVFPPDLSLPVVLMTAEGEAGEALSVHLRHVYGGQPPLVSQGELQTTLILPACTSMGRSQILSALREAKLLAPLFISTPCYSGKQLTEAFRAIEELQRLAFLYPGQGVFCQELLKECNSPSGFCPETVSAMEAALKKGQLEVAQAKWLLLLGDIRGDRYGAFSFAIHYVDKMLSALEAEYGAEGGGPIDAALTSLGALQEHIDGRLRRITEAQAASQQQLSDMLCDAVWREIHRLYNNENCCSQMIADQLGMSQSYLSRQFRSGTGMSINDAVQHVRIDKVCKLLGQSSQPVEQIARQAGYSNTKYFFVLFKKYTGKTPVQFRSELPAAEGQG